MTLTVLRTPAGSANIIVEMRFADDMFNDW